MLSRCVDSSTLCRSLRMTSFFQNIYLTVTPYYLSCMPPQIHRISPVENGCPLQYFPGLSFCTFTRPSSEGFSQVLSSLSYQIKLFFLRHSVQNRKPGAGFSSCPGLGVPVLLRSQVISVVLTHFYVFRNSYRFLFFFAYNSLSAFL